MWFFKNHKSSYSLTCLRHYFPIVCSSSFPYVPEGLKIVPCIDKIKGVFFFLMKEGVFIMGEMADRTPEVWAPSLAMEIHHELVFCQLSFVFEKWAYSIWCNWRQEREVRKIKWSSVFMWVNNLVLTMKQICQHLCTCGWLIYNKVLSSTIAKSFKLKKPQMLIVSVSFCCITSNSNI